MSFCGKNEEQTKTPSAFAAQSQLPRGGSPWHDGKVSGFARGPIPEGAVCAADWGSFGRYPLGRYAPAPPRGRQPSQSAHCVRSQLPQGDAFGLCRKLYRRCESRPLGEGGKAAGFDGRGCAPTQKQPQIFYIKQKRCRQVVFNLSASSCLCEQFSST